MSTHIVRHRGVAPAHLSGAAREQLRWIVGGLALGFLVSFVFADLIEVPRDLYYAIYGLAVMTFFWAWTRATHQRLGEMIRRRWVLALALGVAAAGALAIIVVRTETATSRPGGIGLVGAVLWRGVFYGAIDGLLLSAFPILAVFAAFAGTRLLRRRAGRLAVGALAILASLAMTAAYHAGYGDFRSAKLRSPEVGDLVWSVPTLATLNPIGAPIAHAGLHVSAVLHSYDTEVFLPPHR
jgi:hypothetical protein